MNFRILNKNDQQDVTELFTSAFTASEGAEEGKLIGNLASELSLSIDHMLSDSKRQSGERAVLLAAGDVKHQAEFIN